MIDWREAHRWLAGYSAARAGKPEPNGESQAYYAGYKAGGGDFLPAAVRWPDGAPT